MIVLSVLIPSIPEHKEKLTILLNELIKQVDALKENHSILGEVEIVYDDSKRFLDGGLSIGKKREALVNKAVGRYLCFCDCDDWVSPNYIETLVRLCLRNADVVTFRNFSRLDNYWMLVDMSINYPNDEANPNFTVRRKCWHICPIKSEYAKMYKFPDINHGEDAQWLDNVLSHCTTEVHTDQILHMYNYNSTHSESDKIIRQGYV